jgi:adenine deaminase
MLEKGHINKLVSALIKEGYNIFDVIRSCTKNPVNHYGLESGLLQEGDNADFILVDRPENMNVLETWIKGEKVFSDGEVKFNYSRGEGINNFNCSHINIDKIRVKRSGNRIRVIKALDGELITNQIIYDCPKDDFVSADTKKDILKIVVKDRYRDLPPVVGFINGFGLKMGAFASSVAHDCHNIICVGANDRDIIDSINEVIRLKGGLAVASDGSVESFQLNIGGIMSGEFCSKVARSYEELTAKVRQMGCGLSAPFMTLSFMALLVIPELKISDKGLFDVTKFSFTSLFTE